MALLELKIDLNRTAAALERIASALERAVPLPKLPSADVRPSGPEKLHIITDEALWEQEQEDEARLQQRTLNPQAPQSREEQRRQRLRREGKLPLPE